MRKFQAVVTAGLILSLAACAGPGPLLKSNARLQMQGREMAKFEVIICQQKAEAAGLKPGTGGRSGNMATGAGLGLISGAAIGASSGIIGGLPGVTIGAAVGGALGVIIGSVGGAYRPLDPDPAYADAVLRRPSLDARSGRSISPHPLGSEQASLEGTCISFDARSKGQP
ncbi:MAG: hypothetical protein E8D50_07690 [Nitrospira sp.]|nr:MAG: hypothetical protein E8D50_07690 [Nitrospira sp.]